MPKHPDATNAAPAFGHDSTLVVALELSTTSWQLGAVVPGVSRRPRRGLAPGDIAGVLAGLAQWRAEAARAGRAIRRVVLTYEAGRDGFWIARLLEARGLDGVPIEVLVLHPASIPVPRKGRRAKTDRIDLDMMLRTILAWLRGEPRVCTLAPVPGVAEEDARRPGRERERLVGDRTRLEGQIKGLLALHGVTDFAPRRKRDAARLATLTCFDGTPLPPHAMAELERLMAHHRLVSDQIAAIEAERDRIAATPAPDQAVRQIQLLMLVGAIAAETATTLVREVFVRSFASRRQLAGYVGLTGNPFQSGTIDREQGVGPGGNARARRIMIQLAWRWLRHQPGSALSRWYRERTRNADRRMRKILIIALARKLLIALWRYAQTGEPPEGVHLARPA